MIFDTFLLTRRTFYLFSNRFAMFRLSLSVEYNGETATTIKSCRDRSTFSFELVSRFRKSIVRKVSKHAVKRRFIYFRISVVFLYDLRSCT